MTRISLDPPRTLSYRIGEWFIRRRFGEVLDPYRAQGHSIAVAKAFGALEKGAANWKRLDQRTRDLAELVAATTVGCPWCMDFGYWIMHMHGFTREEIEAVPHWRDSDLFTPLERLVMEYAEAMTRTPPAVEDELVAKLRRHLDEAQLVELTAVVCLENVRSRFNAAVGLPRQGFKERCELSVSEEPVAHAAAAGGS
jgi:AhpD family alkylhydroperoxidase